MTNYQTKPKKLNEAHSSGDTAYRPKKPLPNWSVKPAHMERVAMYIGALYRQSRIRVELATHGAMYDMVSAQFQTDCSFISRVDKALLACRSEYQKIIRKEFLEEHEENWYLKFYTKEAFRRKLKRALEEFFSHM